MPSTRLLALLAVLALLVAACSFSHSSQSSSDSSGSSSDSSGSSSESSQSAGWLTPRTQYERDIGSYAASYARRGDDDFATFQKNVAALAARNGVTDWERDASTWLGIGFGLARAGFAPDELEEIELSWADASRDRIAWLQEGYAAGRHNEPPQP